MGDGHRYEDGDCKPNQCFCDNGYTAVSDCKVHQEFKCSGCWEGFNLAPDYKCYENQCKCNYGVADKGASCNADGTTQKWLACNDGYEKNTEDKCEKKAPPKCTEDVMYRTTDQPSGCFVGSEELDVTSSDDQIAVCKDHCYNTPDCEHFSIDFGTSPVYCGLWKDCQLGGILKPLAIAGPKNCEFEPFWCNGGNNNDQNNNNDQQKCTADVAADIYNEQTCVSKGCSWDDGASPAVCQAEQNNTNEQNNNNVQPECTTSIAAGLTDEQTCKSKGCDWI